MQDEPVDYTQHSFLWQHSIAARLTGNLNGNPMTIIGEKFLTPAADRILAIGSGMAFTEEAFVKAGYFHHVIAFELSEAAVDAANARLKQIGLSDAIEMRAGNVLEAKLADASFDVVFVQAAIHHFFNIEEMFEFMHRVLKPGGLLIFDEYIGPDLHQYDPVVIAISNEINNCLAERYRRDTLRAGEVRTEVPFATMEWMLQMDPSEGVHASQIMPLTEKWFDIAYRGEYGGSIMRPFWVGILPNFDFSDPADQTIARLIILIEDIMLRSGAIKHYHAKVVARRRPRARLEATGERYIPTKMQPEVAVEHWHRYLVASRFVAGKRVLDIACGEGYGSSLLSQTAASVVGVDISAETVAYASEAYRRDNLRFLVGSCAAIPLADASADVVVSFETLEHHGQHEEMFREFKRVLAPGGLCLVSTPDRIVYSEIPGYSNPFHVKELTAREFEDLVGRHFARHRILGQKYLLGSVLTGTEAGLIYLQQANSGEPPRELPFDPKYLIALASDWELPVVSGSVLESGDKTEEEQLNYLLRQLTSRVEVVEAEKRACVDAVTERDAVIETLVASQRQQETVIQAYINAAADRTRERDEVAARLESLAARFALAKREIDRPLRSKMYRHLLKKTPNFD